jgi:hypothetical protein
MVGDAAVGQVDDGTDGAGFGVVGTVDELANARLDDRPGTHGTGFEGDVEATALEVPAVEDASSVSQGEDFGVGGGVAIALFAVTGTGDELILGIDDDGPDGNFSVFSGFLGQVQGVVHPLSMLLEFLHGLSFPSLVAVWEGVHLGSPEEAVTVIVAAMGDADAIAGVGLSLFELMLLGVVGNDRVNVANGN